MKALQKESQTNYPLLKLHGADLKDRLKKITPFMSTEETRYYLCGVYFKYAAADRELMLVATNGHILCKMRITPETEDRGDDFDFIIHSSSVKHICSVMPKGAFPTMKVLDDGAHVRFDFGDFEYICNTVDGRYPDYSKVIPNGDSQVKALNAKYLTSVLKALGNKPVNIFLDSKSDPNTSPHLFNSDEADGIQCVIMPMRA